MIQEKTFTIKESWYPLILYILYSLLFVSLCISFYFLSITLGVCFTPIHILGMYIIHSIIKKGAGRIVFFDNDLLIENRNLLIPWSDIESITIYLIYNSAGYRKVTGRRNVLLRVKTTDDEKYALQSRKKQKKIERILFNIKSKYNAKYGLLVAILSNYNCTILKALELFVNKAPNIQILVYEPGFRANLDESEKASINQLIESTGASITISPY